LPDVTVEAFSNRGNLALTITKDIDQANTQWSQLKDFGVDVADVAARLEREGVKSFQNSFDELISVLTAKATELNQ
jgi:transaldolase